MQPFVIFLHLVIKILRIKNYNMKKSLLILLTIFFMVPLAKASHIVGGEISVQWVGPTQNDFQIQVRVFRSCQSGSAGMPTSVGVDLHDLGTYSTVTSWSLSSPVITTNIPFSDPCFTPVGICVDQGLFTQNVTIPDNASGNGYFLEYQICCRNSGVINLATPTSDGMTFYCEIPNPADPGALNNSSPDMGAYPLSAFFCVNSPKTFQFNVTDVDGDSLVYSLVTPLNDGTMNASPAFPYSNVGYAGGFSLANMIGGPSPLVIDQNTGIMTGAPAMQGSFVFGVLVEEFRNGVKIGEVRRDAQFEAQAGCTTGNPLTFSDPAIYNGAVLPMDYNKLYCKDFVYTDPNGDSLYMALNSTMFDSGAYYPTMVPDINGNYTYYTDWNGTSYNNTFVIPPNTFDPIVGAEVNQGVIGQRICFTPQCSQIGEIFPFQVSGFSLGCDGISGDTIDFFFEVSPPVVDFRTQGDQDLPYGQEYCRNVVFHDTNIVDMIKIKVTSDIFSEGAEYPSLSSSYSYENWVYPTFPSTTYPPNSFSTGVANGGQNTGGVLATRFCWTPDCEHIGKTYDVRAILSSVDCPTGIQDTIDFSYTVVPPFDSLDVIPNVITPNGDGFNDFYTLGYVNEDGERVGGVSNPCHDEIKIQIFNRWGLLVYESTEYPEFQWDGTNKGGGKVAAGTYFVLISGTYGNETVTLDQRSVTVINPQ